MIDILNLIGREKDLFSADIKENEAILSEKISNSAFLIIGGAGSIGQAVTKEIFVRNPLKLHVADLSENNLVELVRDIRSSFGYIDGNFRTFAIDCGSQDFEIFFKNEGPYDYVLNLSALKHVRSEKDPYTLMRMIETNILNTIKTLDLAADGNVKKYFCVSTDKAANPVNMMGASKRIMEMFLIEKGDRINISTARFANVAFSDGSLLHGFNQRLLKKQPLAAPSDIKRYFVTPKEAGELCIMSALLGDNRDIYFPKISEKLKLITFTLIAERFLENHGYSPYLCESENEARTKIDLLIKDNKWPCFFTESNTTGEKDFEEFFTAEEIVDNNKYSSIGIVKNTNFSGSDKLKYFENKVYEYKKDRKWTKEDLITLFQQMLPEFNHKEKMKSLDEKM